MRNDFCESWEEEETQMMMVEGQDENFDGCRKENGRLRMRIKKLEGKCGVLQIEIDDGLVRNSDLNKQLRRISG